MPAKKYTVTLATNLPAFRVRAVCFLECAGDDGINGRKAFLALASKKERELRTRFDHWVEGLDVGSRVETYKKWFHGWPNHPKYKKCYVFKWKERRLNHRLYGFLINPTPVVRPRLQLCILAYHTTKTERETEEYYLDGSIRLLNTREAVEAIQAKIASLEK